MPSPVITPDEIVLVESSEVLLATDIFARELNIYSFSSCISSSFTSPSTSGQRFVRRIFNPQTDRVRPLNQSRPTSCQLKNVQTPTKNNPTQLWLRTSRKSNKLRKITTKPLITVQSTAAQEKDMRVLFFDYRQALKTLQIRDLLQFLNALMQQSSSHHHL